MTLGKASPARSASATHRAPAGARVFCRHLCGIDGEFQRKMGEDMRDRAGQLFAIRPGKGRRQVPTARRKRLTIPSSALRSCRRAGPSAAANAQAPCRPRAWRRRPRRAAASPLGFGAFTRKALRIAAPPCLTALAQRADAQAGRCGVQMRGAEIHQRLGKIARRARAGVSVCGERPDRRFRRGQRLFHGEQPRNDALDIAVHRRRRDGRRRWRRWPRRYRRRCRAASASLFRSDGNCPPCSFDHRLSAGMQVARSRVIAKPGPGLQHILSGAAARLRTSGQRWTKRTK